VAQQVPGTARHADAAQQYAIRRHPQRVCRWINALDKVQELITVRLDMDIATIISRDFPVDERGYLTDSGGVMLALRRLRPDFAEKKMHGQIMAKSVLANQTSRTHS
jgi:hypothetical protein